jgi:hypothetical protein
MRQIQQIQEFKQKSLAAQADLASAATKIIASAVWRLAHRLL